MRRARARDDRPGRVADVLVTAVAVGALVVAGIAVVRGRPATALFYLCLACVGAKWANQRRLHRLYNPPAWWRIGVEPERRR